MNIEHMRQEYERIGKNFMTPEILKYDFDGNRIIELSKGTDFSGGTIYGVTELVYEECRLSTTRRGQMHRTLKSATKHYKVLLNK